jgi:hypothetical protein
MLDDDNDNRSFLDSVSNDTERKLLSSLLDRFPSSGSDAREIKEVEWRHKLFTPHHDGSTTYVPLPKNIVDFKDSLLFIAILKAFESQGYKVVVSDKELPATVFKTDKAAYFAGYVSKSQDKFVGDRIKPTNQFEKGQLAKQTEAVIAHVGKRNAHIRRTPHSIGKTLAEMGGFTRQYWAFRSAISAIFTRLPNPQVDNVSTFMLSGGELIGKIVRKSLPYQNGGVFRQEELRYLDMYYRTELTTMEKIHKLCQNPSNEFANSFDEKVDELAKICKSIEKDLGALFAQRAAVLFRSQSRKKSDIKWAQKPLNEKLNQLKPEDLRRLFSPTNLPGFVKAERTVDDKDTVEEFCIEKYRLDDGKLTFEAKLSICVSYETLLADMAVE